MSYGRNGTNGYTNGYGSQPSRYDDDYRGSGDRAGGSEGGSAGGARVTADRGGRRDRRAGGYGAFNERDDRNSEPAHQRSRSNGNPYQEMRSNGNPYEERESNGNPYAARTQDSFDTYDGPLPPVPAPSSRRNDGYGGRGARDRERNRDNGRERDRDRNRDRLRSDANDSRIYGDGPTGKQIEGVVQHINEKWSVLTKSNCVPVQLALQLMDTSSLGRGNDYDDFKSTSKALHKGLKAIVNEHHQGFNSSIGTFHKILSGIQASQDRVHNLKSSLIDAKANLTVARVELKGFAAASQSYDNMLQVLSQIEKIQTLPEQLDARISEKRFLTAVNVLQDALRLIRNSSLENIGALADLRVYLNNQETSLTDILLEELHDHLYLKSPYCQNRWKPYSSSPAGDTLDPGQSVSNMSTGISPLYRFLTNLNPLSPMVDDASRNPEEDSFEYIHMIIEALNKMGCLDMAVDRMEHRLPLELFSVIEKTIQEVDQRHPAHLRAAQAADPSRPDIKTSGSDSSEAVLTDLLHTSYSKFEAIAEGHRAVHEVIAGIVQREGIKKTDALMKGFKELWKLYQSEMRSLLHDYLATDGNPLSRDGIKGPRGIFDRNQRDKQKRVFKLADLDKKAINREQDDLDKILKVSVPGLVSKSHRQSVGTSGIQTLAFESPAAGHKLLVDPSVFNISVLLPPSLIFLQRLKDTVPPDSDIAVSTLTSFLDDFLVNVFNPQLDDTVTELCTQSFLQPDAFQEDPQWSDHAKMPIFKGTYVFFSLIREFCRMLDDIPQDQVFSSLIIAQLNTYFDRCKSWAETLVGRLQEGGITQLKPAAAVVNEGSDILQTVKSIWCGEDDERDQLIQEEVDLIIAHTNERPVGPFDIITDKRGTTSLCLLYSSMQWLSSQLTGLRSVVKKEDLESTPGQRTSRWNMLNAAAMRDGDHPVTLPLTADNVGQFDHILVAYQDLATKALYTLHVDVRFNVAHMITKVLQSHYYLDQPVHEPDRSILQLNSDILSFDDILSLHLPAREYGFLTSGLGTLLDSLLVVNASRITAMNGYGCDRMQLNILVLQQNLKSVETDGVLYRSAQFFNYFSQGPKAIVQMAKETGGQGLGFNLEEFKILVGLCYSEALKSQSREVSAQAKRAMGDDKLQLTEYMWST